MRCLPQYGKKRHTGREKDATHRRLSVDIATPVRRDIDVCLFTTEEDEEEEEELKEQNRIKKSRCLEMTRQLLHQTRRATWTGGSKKVQSPSIHTLMPSWGKEHDDALEKGRILVTGRRRNGRVAGTQTRPLQTEAH